MAKYIVRQEFINKGKGNYLNYNKVQKLLQSGADYQAIPAKASQQVLILLDKNWLSFFQAIRAYNECPSIVISNYIGKLFLLKLSYSKKYLSQSKLK